MGPEEAPDLPAGELEDHYRRRRAAHERAAVTHEQAAEVERRTAAALDHVGRTERADQLREMAAANDEKAVRSRQIAAEQLEHAEEQRAKKGDVSRRP